MSYQTTDNLLNRTYSSPLLMVFGFLMLHDFATLLSSSFDWNPLVAASTGDQVLLVHITRRLWLAGIGVFLLFRIGLFEPAGFMKLPGRWQKRAVLPLFCLAAFVVQEGFGHFFDRTGDCSSGLIFMSLVGDLAIGIQEEIWFRGVVFLVLLRAWCQPDNGGASRNNVLQAILVSSLFFGAWHIQNAFNGQDFYVTLMQIGYTFNLGIIFAVMMLVTGSIWVPILAHGFFDIGVSLGSVASWGAKASEGPEATLLEAFQAYGSFVFLTTILALLSLRYLSSLEPGLRARFGL